MTSLKSQHKSIQLTSLKQLITVIVKHFTKTHSGQPKCSKVEEIIAHYKAMVHVAKIYQGQQKCSVTQEITKLVKG